MKSNRNYSILDALVCSSISSDCCRCCSSGGTQRNRQRRKMWVKIVNFCTLNYFIFITSFLNIERGISIKSILIFQCSACSRLSNLTMMPVMLWTVPWELATLPQSVLPRVAPREDLVLQDSVSVVSVCEIILLQF